MNKNLRTRGIVIGLVAFFSLLMMFGPWNRPKEAGKLKASDFIKLKQNLGENIKLGLDLKGGTHLVLQVQTDDALKALTEGNQAKAVEILKKENIVYKDVKAPTIGQVVVETENTNDHDKIKDKLQTDFTSDWEVRTNASPASVTFNLKTSAADIIRKQVTDQEKTIIEQRINAFGVAEPTIQLHGSEEDHQILVQMPGLDNPDRVKELIKGQSKLELKAVVGTLYKTKEEAEAAIAGATDKEAVEINEKRNDGSSAMNGWYVVEKIPIVSGIDLRNAQGVPNGQGLGYKVNFQLKPAGAEKFGTWTGAHIGTQLAIVLDSKIKSAPTIQGQISDSGEITGNFTQQEAEDLGLTLRSGALPAGIKYLEERTVGPSLGADSIRQGINASIFGLGLVIVFMFFYYRFSGLNAVVALVLNLIILLAGLALFGAVLTLPGIAGVILSIGMAVDSNVLIFERIREELKAGKIVHSAMSTGFDKALVTIIDTHVTTIVSSAFLYFFGNGPIRGFAVTLTISLLANLFTAIYVSRSMFLWTLNRGGRKAESISI
ncbi:MAG: protein translocase subunit SecD [Acidobacteria bacterium]|nr:protein translocase subunit SecD [Acidobacteriota bacterium]